MPLTDAGNKVHANMVSEYGSEKGERVFYASMNKDKSGKKRRKWEGRRGRARAVKKMQVQED